MYFLLKFKVLAHFLVMCYVVKHKCLWKFTYVYTITEKRFLLLVSLLATQIECELFKDISVFLWPPFCSSCLYFSLIQLIGYYIVALQGHKLPQYSIHVSESVLAESLCRNWEEFFFKITSSIWYTCNFCACKCCYFFPLLLKYCWNFASNCIQLINILR